VQFFHYSATFPSNSQPYHDSNFVNLPFSGLLHEMLGLGQDGMLLQRRQTWALDTYRPRLIPKPQPLLALWLSWPTLCCYNKIPEKRNTS
jgi:hypothetical protein